MSTQICTRCVMDTTDPEIIFDNNGYCNHCTNALLRLKNEYFPNSEGQSRLINMINSIKSDGVGKKYDCIIGLSGGVDSSYLAWKTKDWGLRVLLFHVDGGWNTPESTHNVKVLAQKLGYDLHIHTIDWDEMRDLQVAYLSSELPDLDVPQDHAFFAILFKNCEKFGIHHWLSGMNLVSESILPSSWEYTSLDSRQVIAVHKQFGKRPLSTYPLISFWEYCKFYGNIPFISKIQMHSPLNFMPYNVITARKELQSELGWQDYGRKHEESRFTKLLQNYIHPVKFGYDKRKPHYSSLIISGVMTRDEAIEALQQPLCSEDELHEDIAYVCDRLGLSSQEWDAIMDIPIKNWKDFPNFENYKRIAREIKRLLRR